VVDILMRRRQNNPILTGEAGVGKTAVVEGFALRVAQGDVPPPLRNVIIRTLDLALLQAGAGIKGEFENRLKGLIEEVKASPIPIILFIDEAHTMIGAGAWRAAHDRGYHLVGVQKIFRERSRLGAPLPGRQSGRAD
jgi:type VI secretion system protein VasG